MKKNTLNLIINSFLLLLFLPLVSTGLVLHQFPRGLGGVTALGFTRHEWVDIHLTIAVLLLIFTGIHLLLHYNWKNAFTNHLSKIWSRVLAVAVLALFIVTLLAPFVITNNLPDTRGYGNRSGKGISGGGWGRNAADTDYQEWSYDGTKR